MVISRKILPIARVLGSLWLNWNNFFGNYLFNFIFCFVFSLIVHIFMNNFSW